MEFECLNVCYVYNTKLIKFHLTKKEAFLSHSFNQTREGLEVKGSTLDNQVLL